MSLSLAAKLMKSLKMRHNLMITILAVLLLFQNKICQGSRIDDTAKDVSSFPGEGHEDTEHELNSGEPSTDTDDDSVDRGIAPEDDSRIKRNMYAEDFSVGHGGLPNSPTHENLKSEDPLSSSESRASATGISVANGRAVGYGRASISGGDHGYFNGQGQAYNPGVQTVEEFAEKSGKDIAIASLGGGGRSGDGASPSGGGYPGINYPVNERRAYDSGHGEQGGPVRPITGSVDNRNAYDSGYGNDRGPTRSIIGTANERGTYDRGYVNERTPTRPIPSAVDERGSYDTGYGNKGTPTRTVTGVADNRGSYDRGYGNERTPTRPIPSAVDERGSYDTGYGNKGTPTRTVTGVAGNRGSYDRGYGNERGTAKPSTGYQGTDRRVTDDRYPVPDTTGVKIRPAVDKDGRVVYAYDTDGRPTQVFFTDGNGGTGVVNHFFEKKNLDNGLRGDGKVTGTSFRSGFSLAYGGGNSGNGGAVAYGSGNSGNGGAVAYGSGNTGAVAYGSGIKIPRKVGYGIGDGPAAAYAGSVREQGPVAFASGSGFVSGTGIKIGDAYVGKGNGRTPGVRSTGFSLAQGTVIGNGKGYSRSVIYV